jgi:transcriptional repressor NrdR
MPRRARLPRVGKLDRFDFQWLMGSMKCRYCDCQDTRVIDSRDSSDLAAVRRRRQCIACGKRFTTYERHEAAALQVVKRDGRVEDFDRDKLEVGILKACEKRPIPRDTISAVLDEIEEQLRGEGPKVTSAHIGDLVLERLQALDEVAYIRFASVYKAFKDASHFQREVITLIQAKGAPDSDRGRRGDGGEDPDVERT